MDLIQTEPNGQKPYSQNPLGVVFFAAVAISVLGLILNFAVRQLAYNWFWGFHSVDIPEPVDLFLFFWPTLIISVYFIKLKLKDLVKNNPNPAADLVQYSTYFWVFYFGFSLISVVFLAIFLGLEQFQADPNQVPSAADNFLMALFGIVLLFFSLGLFFPGLVNGLFEVIKKNKSKTLILLGVLIFLVIFYNILTNYFLSRI